MTAMIDLPTGLYRAPPELAVAFRERMGLLPKDIGRLLGFPSGSAAVYRWEINGPPGHVEVIMAYVDKYGPELAESIAKKRDDMLMSAYDPDKHGKFKKSVRSSEFKVSAGDVWQWRTRHKLRQIDVERLMGYSSNGRTLIGWESRGAPPFFETLMAYFDKHGFELAEKLAGAREV